MGDDRNALGRNDPCHCGSGKKYKHCCLVKDEDAARRARAAMADAGEAPAEPGPHEKASARPQTFQPWKGRANTKGFQKRAFQRKSG